MKAAKATAGPPSRKDANILTIQNFYPAGVGIVHKRFMAQYHQLADRFVVAADLQTTWAFFSAPENLSSITPPWLKFTINSPAPKSIETGTLLNYRIRWMGLSIPWRTRIIDCCAPRQFIDLQVSGPYRLWHHTHTFSEVADGVECSDRIVYALPMGLLGNGIHAVSVKNQLLEIFHFRRKVIAQHLGWVRELEQVRSERL